MKRIPKYFKKYSTLTTTLTLPSFFKSHKHHSFSISKKNLKLYSRILEMRFRFCGDLDCPDWVLSEVATLSKLSSVRIKVLVNQILAYCIAGTFNYEKVLKLAADNADGISDLKGSVAAVHFMITNAAKHDVDELSLVQEIQQLGLPKENSENIGRSYREHKDTLRAQLAADSYRVAKLLSTEWRVDHIISSSAEESSLSQSLIHMKFVIDSKPHLAETAEVDGARIEEVACEMSSAKLDVLVHELTHALTLLQGMES